MASNSIKALLDVRQIMERLPHRFPFLLVDKVIDLESGKRIRAIKNVTYNEPFFMGHFPRYPVMPGVLIIEAMAQVAGILAHASPNEKDDALYLFAGIDKARFRRQVVPGDQLVMEVHTLQTKGMIGKYSACAFVEDELACEAQIMCAKQVIQSSQ